MDFRKIFLEYVTLIENVQDKIEQYFSGVHFPNIVLYVHINTEYHESISLLFRLTIRPGLARTVRVF
jgi:hypothetical protein